MVQSLLIGMVRLLKVFHHQEAMTYKPPVSDCSIPVAPTILTKTTPYLSIVTIETEYALEKFHRSWEVFFGSKNT